MIEWLAAIGPAKLLLGSECTYKGSSADTEGGGGQCVARLIHSAVSGGNNGVGVDEDCTAEGRISGKADNVGELARCSLASANDFDATAFNVWDCCSHGEGRQSHQGGQSKLRCHFDTGLETSEDLE